MKHITAKLLAVAAAAMMTACTIESSDNGNLDGYWHLMSADTLATGGTADMSQQRIFWAVNYHLFRLNDLDGGAEAYYMRFRHNGDSLSFTEAYIDHWHQDTGDDGGDVPVSDTTALAHYYVTNLPQHYIIESMSSSKLILRSDKYRLKFRKQ